LRFILQINANIKLLIVPPTRRCDRVSRA